MTGWYSRFLLTVIAIAVVVIATQGVIEHVQADRAAQSLGSQRL